jgi:C1A family cysteine protease
VVANDVDGQRTLLRNSWGTGWGLDGHAWLAWTALDSLLGDGGDVVQPVM